MICFAKILIFHLLLSETLAENILESVYLQPMSQSSEGRTGCTLKKYSVRSKLDCVRRCLSLTFSTGLTYTDLAPNSGSCVCLASCVTANISTFTTSGTVYFNFVDKNPSGPEWLNKSCTTIADCPVEHSICFSATSTCLCTPGYYYSIGCNTCVLDCDSGNLQDAFLKYDRACTGGYLKETIQGNTLEECKERCVYSRECMSIDYFYRGPYCFLNYLTALTSHTFFENCNRGPADHYQRLCL